MSLPGAPFFPVKKQDQIEDTSGITSGDLDEAIRQEMIDVAGQVLLDQIRTARIINLLQDIIQQASDNPAQLTAFNSPLLHLACLEVYEHNNPELAMDDNHNRQRGIWQERVYDQRRRTGKMTP